VTIRPQQVVHQLVSRKPITAVTGVGSNHFEHHDTRTGRRVPPAVSAVGQDDPVRADFVHHPFPDWFHVQVTEELLVANQLGSQEKRHKDAEVVARVVRRMILVLPPVLVDLLGVALPSLGLRRVWIPLGGQPLHNTLALSPVHRAAPVRLRCAPHVYVPVHEQDELAEPCIAFRIQQATFPQITPVQADVAGLVHVHAVPTVFGHGLFERLVIGL